MTGLWPEDWRLELARAFDPAECGPTIEVVFIGPDGQPVGEPLVITGVPKPAMGPSTRELFDRRR